MLRSVVGYLRTFTGFGRDARLFLLVSIAFGAAYGLYWADFNLYLEAIGADLPTIGLIMASSQLAGVAVTLPVGSLAATFGCRRVMVGGLALVALGSSLLLVPSLPFLFVGVVGIGAGAQALLAVEVAYVADHTSDGERNEYFSLLQAVGFLTTMLAMIIGGFTAPFLASLLPLGTSAGPYRILLLAVAVLSVLSALVAFALSDDRKPHEVHHARRFGLVVRDKTLFIKLLLPGFLAAVGSGQIIPFLNVFIHDKFHLELTAINAMLGITSLGTVVAVLLQPALAKRFGRIRSIVLVQAASIPLLVVLGFSPMLWTVMIALVVRDALMNAGAPLFDAYAMSRISQAERATLSAALSFVFAAGWTIAPVYFSFLQASFGSQNGYAAAFVTITILYTMATGLLWLWFRVDVPETREPTAEPAGA
jgi:MFS family permease